MTALTSISVATDFSRFPAGRDTSDGPFSGERFRSEILLPALRDAADVVVDLAGTLGYGSSFLEEAFGGLVRIGGYTEAHLRAHLTVLGPAIYVAKAWEHISEAQASANA